MQREKFVKRIVNVCCLQETGWRGHGSRMLGWRKGDVGCGGLD